MQINSCPLPTLGEAWHLTFPFPAPCDTSAQCPKVTGKGKDLARATNGKLWPGVSAGSRSRAGTRTGLCYESFHMQKRMSLQKRSTVMPFTGRQGAADVVGGIPPGNSCDTEQLTSRHDRALQRTE